MGVGEISGGALAPVIAGIASDAWGLQSAMYIAAGGAAIAVLLSLGLHETAPRVLERRGIAHAEVPGVAEYTEHPDPGHARADCATRASRSQRRESDEKKRSLALTTTENPAIGKSAEANGI